VEGVTWRGTKKDKTKEKKPKSLYVHVHSHEPFLRKEKAPEATKYSPEKMRFRVYWSPRIKKKMRFRV